AYAGMVLAAAVDAAAVRAGAAGTPHPGLGVGIAGDTEFRPLRPAAEAVRDADMVIVAVASPGLVPTLSALSKSATPDTIWVLATKGWQEDTLLSPSEVATSILGPQTAVVALAGPGLASEIIAASPTALLCASRSPEARRAVARVLSSPSMLTMTTSDIVGAETASAYKNVVAIAVGMAEGLSQRFTRSALVRSF